MRSTESLADRVAVVTGSTRGIGRAIARCLASAGCRVVVVGRTGETGDAMLPGSVEETVAELTAAGATALGIRGDLRDESQTQAIVDQTIDRFGGCDVLINNAAYTSNGPILSVPWHRWSAAFRVQVVAPLQMALGFAPTMRERGRGVVLNVSSGASQRVTPGLALYSSSKLAMEQWSQSMALELRETGIDVNVLRVDRLVATEGWQHIAQTQGLEIATGGSPDAIPITSASAADSAVWMVSQPQGWTGNILGFEDITALGGPKVSELDLGGFLVTSQG